MSINPTDNTIEAIFINSKSNLKDIQLKKELCFLFLSNAFAKMYLDGTTKSYPKVEHLAFVELGKKSKVYGKQINNILEDSFKAFDFIEKQELKKVNKGVKHRFQKRLSFNENQELEVHGLLFCVALILEHKEIKNKKIFLPYKTAQNIYNDFDGKNGNIYKNARLLPSLFREYLKI